MAKVEHFEDLEVWQLARRLTGKIYTFARQDAFARDFGFRDQICRAAVSIVSNIAEGFERRTNSQFLQFLDIANGSAGELRAQLYIALDLAYITPDQFREALADVSSIGKMLSSLIQYLRLHPTPSAPPPTTKPPNHQPTKPSPLSP
ncbi:MAG: four helix bundle protein [Kiritimatiellae bacterium]|nr:four helix bundle protein [Kiritimatiellia bacterium]